MKTKTIKQSVTFRAKPHDVYEALMDSDKHSRFTGGKAHISRQIGGKFSTFDGYSEGVNIELVPDKKIVQSWRAGDWPEGHYSQGPSSQWRKMKPVLVSRSLRVEYQRFNVMTYPRGGMTTTGNQ